MLGKGRHIALLLFTAFVFKVLFVNIALAAPLGNMLAKTLTAGDLRKIVKSKRSGFAQYNSSADLVTTEVSEESSENDSNENLEKNAKYPSLLLTFFSCIGDIAGHNSLRALAGSCPVHVSDRTYLSISVLRI